MHDAHLAMGNLYKSGHGVTQNFEEAVKCYRKAAERGLPAAENNLGVMYHSGTGVERDDIMAYSMYSLAAEQGSTSARTNRDNLAKSLTPEQIGEAQRRAVNFKAGQRIAK